MKSTTLSSYESIFVCLILLINFCSTNYLDVMYIETIESLLDKQCYNCKLQRNVLNYWKMLTNISKLKINLKNIYHIRYTRPHYTVIVFAHYIENNVRFNFFFFWEYSSSL